MIPLYVDLDGTLLRGDSLHEACTRLLLKPSKFLSVALSLLRGKAAFKQKVIESVELPAATLPYRQDFIEWLKIQKSSGRKLIFGLSNGLLLNFGLINPRAIGAELLVCH